MIITDDRTLQSIQTEFSLKFPFLKIEFYQFPHEPGEGNPNRDKLNLGLLIADVRSSSLVT